MYADPGAAYQRAYDAAVTPPSPVTVSQWADQHRVVANEQSPRPGPWSTALVPYLREIMDCLSPQHPCREVTFKKSAQVAGTEAGINFLGTIADAYPGPTMIVLPTVDLAKAYVKTKLQPAIDASPRLRAKVTEQKARDGGSTTTFKKFPGGWWLVTGANSSAGLQMFSQRFIVKEELSEWPDDVDGRGDPDALVDKRKTAYSRNYKIFNNSTPGLKGTCRISVKFEASDQRHYFVPCPHCDTMQILAWDRLRWSPDAPQSPTYHCVSCGVGIEHHHKRAMLAAGEWRAQRPEPGREPGFHINQLYSPFVGWADTVKEFLTAKGKPALEKVFCQQVLGEDFEEKGESPDHVILMLRREPYQLGRVPAGGLIITRGVDVGADYLIYETVAWGKGKTSWSIDFGILFGDTSKDAVWKPQTDQQTKTYEDSNGRLWPVEMTAVDSGYNSHNVYHWCRHHPQVIAIKGMPGHGRPALGVPSKLDVSYRGKRIKGGIWLWPVGVYHLKAELYGNLGKRHPKEKDGPTLFEEGYCHFSNDHDERYFQQLSAEQLVTRTVKGKAVREWVAKGANHYHDARIYAMTAAEHLGISQITDDGWRRIAGTRGLPIDSDLLAELRIPSAEPQAAVGGEPVAADEPQQPAAPIVAIPPTRVTPRPANRRPSIWTRH